MLYIATDEVQHKFILCLGYYFLTWVIMSKLEIGISHFSKQNLKQKAVFLAFVFSMLLIALLR